MVFKSSILFIMLGLPKYFFNIVSVELVLNISVVTVALVLYLYCYSGVSTLFILLRWR